MKYADLERMLMQDFEAAKLKHDFQEMKDDYELLKELWATGELDSEAFHTEKPPIVHCFAEVRDNKIELPSLYKICKQNLGKDVIYSLGNDGVKIILDGGDDEKIFNYFREEGIETKIIELTSYIDLNPLARRTLELHNSDIIEIDIDGGMIIITKS